MTAAATGPCPKITRALAEVMSEVGYVRKLGHNDFHNYDYATESDLLRVLRPAMVKAGLLLIPSADEPPRLDEHGNTHVSISYTLAHRDGEVWPEKIRAVGCGNDRAKNGNVGDKGTYKALTGANKYLLFKLFQIETGDDPEEDGPPNGNGEGKEKPPAQTRTPRGRQRQSRAPQQPQTLTADDKKALIQCAKKRLEELELPRQEQDAIRVCQEVIPKVSPNKSRADLARIKDAIAKWNLPGESE